MAKSIPPSRDPRDLYFSEKLLGLQKRCSMRHCTEMETSTGWLCYDAGATGWFIGFECPDDGLGGAWSVELQPLIEQALEEAKREGVDVEGIIQQRRQKYIGQ